MRTIATAIFLLGAGMLTTITCPGQTDIAFTYDAGGNRESRSVVTLSSLDQMDTPAMNLMKESLECQVGEQLVRISYNQEEEVLQVNLFSPGRQEATIEFATAEGKPVMKRTGKCSENKIELSGFPAGTYRMTIRVGDAEKVWEIVRT